MSKRQRPIMYRGRHRDDTAGYARAIVTTFALYQVGMAVVIYSAASVAIR